MVRRMRTEGYLFEQWCMAGDLLGNEAKTKQEANISCMIDWGKKGGGQAMMMIKYDGIYDDGMAK